MTVNYPEQSNNQNESNSKNPLHRRIAENLSGRISGGELKPGNKLPSERQIAHQFQASRATVRTALQHLEQEGLITRRDRRSAIVTLRRDIQPTLRIACTSHKIKDTLRMLGEKQLMPARCQLQVVNARCSRAFSDLVTQPASGADVLVCEMEYVDAIANQGDVIGLIPASIVSDSDMPMALRESFVSGGNYKAVPLGISPMVLYYNKAMLAEVGAGIPEGNWHWDQLADIARRFTSGRFGFQIRPKYPQMAALVAGFGGELFNAEGKVGVNGSEGFCAAFRFIADLLATKSVAAAGYDHADLFKEKRCAMAMEGFGKYNEYRDALGSDLGIAILPGAKPAGAITAGFALMIIKGVENLQPIEDMLRTLMLANTQTVLTQQGISLGVSREALSVDRLHNVGVDTQTAAALTAEVGPAKLANKAANLKEGKAVIGAVEELFAGLISIEEFCGKIKGM